MRFQPFRVLVVALAVGVTGACGAPDFDEMTSEDFKVDATARGFEPGEPIFAFETTKVFVSFGTCDGALYYSYQEEEVTLEVNGVPSVTNPTVDGLRDRKEFASCFIVSL